MCGEVVMEYLISIINKAKGGHCHVHRHLHRHSAITVPSLTILMIVEALSSVRVARVAAGEHLSLIHI